MKTKSKIKKSQDSVENEAFYNAMFIFLTENKISEAMIFLEGFKDMPKEIMDKELVSLINSTIEVLTVIKVKFKQLEFMEDFYKNFEEVKLKYDSKQKMK